MNDDYIRGWNDAVVAAGMSHRAVKAAPSRLRNAWHNIVIHPLAGVCWLFGFEAAGDWLHGD